MPLKSVVEGGGEVAGVIVREEVDAGVENVSLSVFLRYLCC